jgi:hypothetical protein
LPLPKHLYQVCCLRGNSSFPCMVYIIIQVIMILVFILIQEYKN